MQINIIAITFVVASMVIGANSFVPYYPMAEITPSFSVVQVVETQTTELSVPEQISEIANEKGFKWTDYLIRLAFCESRFKTDARNDNGYYGTDRGLFQINDFFHPEVSTACADDLKCATEWTMWRINSGYQHEWACNKIIVNKTLAELN